MNYLESTHSLRNRYFVQRHGESLANKLGIILSNPKRGINGYGLTLDGKEQARFGARLAQDKMGLSETTHIWSSDFLRAKQTAKITQRVLTSNQPLLTPKLRERYFGNLDGSSNNNYMKVWHEDSKNPTHTLYGVESVTDVVQRTTLLISELEDLYTNCAVLLVSHGDSLQILQTAFERISAAHHRTLPHLHTGEIKELILK